MIIAAVAVVLLTGCSNASNGYYVVTPCPLSEDKAHHWGMWTNQEQYIQVRSCTNCGVGQMIRISGYHDL